MEQKSTNGIFIKILKIVEMQVMFFKSGIGFME